MEEKVRNEVFCSSCGEAIGESVSFCPRCGVRKSGQQPKNWLVALLLCLFLGYLGVHRFYVGKSGTGVLMLLTLGGLGIWTMIDFVMICLGSFKDVEGRPLQKS